MAKNLFEQFLDFASSKLAGPIAHENIYREEPTGLSGVAKYIAKQELAAKAKEEAAAALSPKATGVEKYLARQAASSAASAGAPVVSEEAVQEPLTGVAKYLAGRYGASAPKAAAAPVGAPEPAPTTRVGRYLAEQGKAAAAPAPAPASEPAPTTRVGKYLAEQRDAASAVKEKASAPKPAAKAAAVAPMQEKVVPQAVVASAESIEAALEEKHAAETSKTAGSIIHLNDGKRCQASTSKGTQCRHTSNLSHIQRTINKQKYMFSVCNQHHNDSFKPYAALMEQNAG